MNIQDAIPELRGLRADLKTAPSLVARAVKRIAALDALIDYVEGMAELEADTFEVQTNRTPLCRCPDRRWRYDYGFSEPGGQNPGYTHIGYDTLLEAFRSIRER
jgi:hypothetical protein